MSYRTMRSFLQCLIVLILGPSSLTAQSPEHWTVARAHDMDTTYERVLMITTVDSVTGQTGVGESIHGRMTKRTLELDVTDTLGHRLRHYSSTRIDRDSIVGTWRSTDQDSMTGSLTAHRDVRRAPKRVQFYPPRSLLSRQYYGSGKGSYSALVPAGIHVMAGDTILTRSRDDAADAPIYIDDALPGDILVVHLLRIAPVGNLAHGGRELMYQWFLTSFARSAGITPRIGDAWALDTASQVAKLSEPTEHLRGFEIPMHPMLGAIGVAPRTPQHWSEEGEWGGNLDYNRIVAGTTLYIPVFNRGAYLYIGSDAHAAQGDGELASQGLEMEADVDFVVDVIPGGASRMKYQLVRAEDGTHIMAFGSAGDLRVASSGRPPIWQPGCSRSTT
jgi:Predicted acetamidase/formamidase